MKVFDRREFLSYTGAAVASVAALNSQSVWALSKLQPIRDTLKSEYPYRGWEDIYRSEYSAQKVGYASHCVNCHGNCAFKIIVKDGIVMREEQIAQYPQINESLPDTNPRGCQKGAIHSQAMYDSNRLRYPMKRVGERGEGKWKRISWDQAAEEIAEKIIDLYVDHGPGCLVTHKGTGALSGVKYAAALRFSGLLGGIHEDGMTDVGDGQAGQYLAFGDQLQNANSDAWFTADYILLSYHNVNVTRIPDAHYVWEAKYRGARIVAASPDYNPTSIHADLWINVTPGSDPFLYMSMVNTILEEDLIDKGFVKEQTDLALLVRKDNGMLLRQSDFDVDGSAEVFYFWDLKTSKAVEASGSMGSESKSIDIQDLDPALEGSYEVAGLEVQPAFVSMKAEAMKFPPESTQSETGLHPDVVREEARRFARAKKAVVLSGFAAGKALNGIYTQWAQILMCALTGHGGDRGGYWSPWTNYGWESVRKLSFEMASGEKKLPRFEAGGLGEFLHGKKIIEARRHYDDERLKQRAGFNLDEMEEMISESVSSGGMPFFPDPKGAVLTADNKFNRNKGPEYRERLLKMFSELLVNVNFRMDSTAMYSDYVLPAASHYEGWDLRVTGLHRFANFFTAPVRPVGEAKEEWAIFSLLTAKIQERAIARGVTSFPDGDFSRDFHTIHDDYTMNGRLATSKDALKFLVENMPQLQGQSFEEGVQKGFLTMYDSPSPHSSKVQRDKPIQSWERQVEDKDPYPTLSGRITFYCDHKWFRKLDSIVPTAKHNAGSESTKYPYTFYTPHTRWGIHSTWRSNKYMMRLQRGEPNVYISPSLASAKGIRDGDLTRVFNGIGDFYAQAKITPSVRDNQVMMEHAWEPYQMREKKGYNHVVATLIQPLELATDWGHLKFGLFQWNPNSLANESSVDIELSSLAKEV